jgi:hypothetical protein
MLLGHHFQNAYVCDNLEAGIDQFRGRGLLKEPYVIEVDQPIDTPNGELINSIRLCFIWIGDVQYELIQPVSDPLGVYDNCLSNGGPLRFHHICMRVPDWADFRAAVDKQDLPFVFERDMGVDKLKFLYLDGRKVFGHYLEYVWMTDEAWEQNRQL